MTEEAMQSTETQATESQAVETQGVSFDTFKEALPETTRNLFEKNGVRDFETLDKSYSGLNELIGKKGLIKPDDNAPDDVRAAYKRSLYKEMGVPEDGKYDFQVPETFTAENEISQSMMDSLAKVGAEHGLSKDGFQNVVNVLGDVVGKLNTQAAEQFGTIDGLKEEWGDKFDDNTKKAELFIDQKLPEAKGLLQLPMFVKLAASLAESSGETKLDTGGSITSQGMGALQEEYAGLWKQQSEASKANNYKELDRIQKRRLDITEKAIAVGQDPRKW